VVVAGLLGATPLAAHALKTVRINGTKWQLPDQSQMKFPGVPHFGPVVQQQWIDGGPAVMSATSDESYKGRLYTGSWAKLPAAPSNLASFYLQACAHFAADPSRQVISTISTTPTRILKRLGEICSYTTATGQLDVLFIFNGSELVVMSAQQIAPDVSQAPLFSTYIKTLQLSRLPR
jgi:hypothetical protein